MNIKVLPLFFFEGEVSPLKTGKFIIYIYIFMRWVQVTLSVTLKSYTFSKPLDLSRFNG